MFRAPIGANKPDHIEQYLSFKILHRSYQRDGDHAADDNDDDKEQDDCGDDDLEQGCLNNQHSISGGVPTTDGQGALQAAYAELLL